MRSTWLVAFVFTLLGCNAERRPPVGDSQPATPTRPLASPPEGRLPVAEGSFAPSEMRLVPGGNDGRWLADVSDCESCHAEITAEWRTSVHASASLNNPIYRASVERFRKDVGFEQSRHCSGCHDISLLIDGATDKAIDPADPRGHGGVGCKTCHGIVETRPDGNGSYTLDTSPIPIPKEGDAESVARHKARVAPKPLRSGELCATCHKVFLDGGTGNAHYLDGLDESTPLRRSVYAGSQLERIDDPIEKKDCRSCHMPAERAQMDDAAAKGGKVASHRFVGGHSYMSAMRGDADALARHRAQLRGAASIDIAAVVHASGERTLPADGAKVVAGQEMVFDVVMRNQRVGHRFPGGVLDVQDSWVELVVEDAHGRRLGEAGTLYGATGEDASAHRLGALLLDKDGHPRFSHEVNHFRTAAANHTILPRDAAVVQIAFIPPQGLSPADLPLEVSARLMHRSRTLELGKNACDASKSKEGLRYQALSNLDGCVKQPITEIANAKVWIGEGWDKRAVANKKPSWRRLLEHAYGFEHAVQERIDEARPSLMKALAEVERVGGPREQAMVLAALGRLESHEGRTEEALRWLDRAAALAPTHPAPLALRGEALSRVWRWSEAALPLEQAALAAPSDDLAWMRLAVARGSLGNTRGALEAALAGLALQPRDADMLRVQALSLRALGGKTVKNAEWAYQEFREADDVTMIRGKCSMNVPGCALERNPVHLHRAFSRRP